VIIVEHIPRFEAARRNESLRFISLVDQMYERHTVLIVSAEAPISALYPPDGPYAFEFRRTCSRLEEMQSKTYLAMGLEI
jgi:cell division protein ZapE